MLRRVLLPASTNVPARDKWRGGDMQQTGFTDMAQTAYYNWCHAILLHHHATPHPTMACPISCCPSNATSNHTALLYLKNTIPVHSKRGSHSTAYRIIITIIQYHKKHTLYSNGQRAYQYHMCYYALQTRHKQHFL